MTRAIDIRCPIYGFIPLDAWEHEIISQAPFQRLRRIRQLAWTDYVYPGAMHTRFEHSLGVMHMVSMLYRGIIERSAGIIEKELGYNEDGKRRYLKLLRLAALLHDVGHGPFSHAAEELLPRTKDGKRHFRHEEYSAAIIRRHFKDVIENHRENNNYNFSIEEIVGLIEGGPRAGRAALWQDLISGQLDADRMDYLLRDAYHAGVEYGRYDWRRIVATIEIVRDPETGAPRIGVSEAGRHAAEGMIIARYMMFNQVYFHKTRVILDFHLQKAIEAMLSGGVFPPPLDVGLEEFLKWDDWVVLGKIGSREGGEHAERLASRNIYRVVWETPEFPNAEDDARLKVVEETLGSLVAARCEAAKSWYKVGALDLPVAIGGDGRGSRPLSMCSTIVGNMNPSRLTRLYVRIEDRTKANALVDRLRLRGT
jgi:hypothetical protein